MERADLGHSDHAASVDWMHLPTVGAIHLQRLVGVLRENSISVDRPGEERSGRSPLARLAGRFLTSGSVSQSSSGKDRERIGSGA